MRNPVTSLWILAAFAICATPSVTAAQPPQPAAAKQAPGPPGATLQNPAATSKPASPQAPAAKNADGSAATQPLTRNDLLKVILVPLLLWLCQALLANAVRRYHTISNLYPEIGNLTEWYKYVSAAFTKWKAGVLDNAKCPRELSRITWDMPLVTTVYDDAQSDIRATLRGREIKRVYELYYEFITLHARFSVLAREIERAKRNEFELEGLPDDKHTQAALVRDEIDTGMRIIHHTAKVIDEKLAKLKKYRSPEQCADEVFHSRAIYGLYGIGILTLLALGIGVFFAM